MGAYAALLSLSQTLDDTLKFHSDLHSSEKEELDAFKGTVRRILDFLEKNPGDKVGNSLETRIITAAYNAEDIPSINNSSPGISMQFSRLFCCLDSLFKDMKPEAKVLQELNILLEELMRIEVTANDDSTGRPVPVSLSTLALNDANNMVGFEDDFYVVKRIIFQQSSQLETIPIYGMGGIGKSTFARALYEDAIRMHRFDRHVWIVVSQEYSFREVLLELLRCLKVRPDRLNNMSDGDLVVRVHQELYGRRYLIVVDDVWTTAAWDKFKIMFPDQTNGSRVLLTTRLLPVANYVVTSRTQPHKMRFLSDSESWSLLKKRVFENNPCPPFLELVGDRIAKSCKGLPLTIVVVAGLLRTSVTKDFWESISRIGSTESTIASTCSNVMSLSYERLSVHLKPCFLYATAYPEDYDINAKQLIRLWIAEGYVKSSGQNSLEELGEGYLDDLVGRSLLLVSKRRYNGRIKSVRIHDVLREFGTSKAKNERFHYGGLLQTMGMEVIPRRLSIHSQESLDLLQKVCDKMTRSLMIFFNGYITKTAPILDRTLLRILVAYNAHLTFEFQNLVHLRYLAFKCDQSDLPVSVFELQNLQTLIIHGVKSRELHDGLNVGLEIWKMASLRHLILPEQSYLEQPPEDAEVEETQLQTLSLATNLELTAQIIKILANLKKLGLFYFGVGEQDWKKFNFSNLIQLEQLDELKIIFENGDRWWTADLLSVELCFPRNLTKLTLENIRRPWEDMEIVGALPKLEVLKLRRMACIGKVWNPLPGQFESLKYLKLEHVYLKKWNADEEHFPRLEVLVLELMGNLQAPLKKIPIEMGAIDTLELIQLRMCEQSIVDSANRIKEQQQEWGNDGIQVLIFN